MTEDQSTLNEEMKQKGRERYKRNAKQALVKGRLETSKTGHLLLDRAIDSVVKGLIAWMEETKGKSTKGGKVYGLIRSLCRTTQGVFRVAAESSRLIINNLSQDNKATSMAYNIGKAIEDECMIRKYKRQEKAAFREASRKIDSRRPSRRRLILRQFAGRDPNFQWKAWTTDSRVSLGYLILWLFESAGFIEFKNVMKSPTKVVKMVRGTEAVQTWLANTDDQFQERMPYYLPMVEPPADWVSIFEGGYPKDVFRKPLVKVDGSKQRKALAEEDMPEFFKAVNHLQSVAYEVNENVLETARHFWKLGNPFAGLPGTNPEEKPPYPKEADTDPQLKIRWKREAARVWARNAKAGQCRIAASQILTLAKRYVGTKFYYPFRADFRGRLYTLPQYLTFQSEDLARGMIQFADAAPLTQESEDWLFIHGANVWGHDKQPFADRIKWTKENLALFQAISENPLDQRQWAEADKPWQALAFCFEVDAYLQAKAAGKPFLTKLPIWIDGSNNGLQLFSLLIRDEVGGKATNVLPNDSPQDIYQEVADVVNESLRDVPADSPDKAKADYWLQFGVNRKATKKIVMTVPYGVTSHSANEYLQEWYEESCQARKIQCLTPGVSFLYCCYLARKIIQAINQVVVGAREAMDWLRSVAQILTKKGFPLKWTSPSGFVVRQAERSASTYRIKLSYGSKLFSPTLGKLSGKLSLRDQKNGISPNFIHSLDASILHLTVNRCFAAGIKTMAVIHDSFGILAPQVNQVTALLLDEIKNIFSKNLLRKFKEETEAETKLKLPDLPRMRALDINQVPNSRYFYS